MKGNSMKFTPPNINKVINSIVTVAVLLLVSPACVQPSYQMQLSFNPSDAEPYLRQGTATITGQAFLTTRGGDVKLAAGREIALYPATPYFAERYLQWGKGISIEPPIPPEAERFIRKTQVDANGNFEFNNLPPGDYFLFVNIVWLAGNSYTGGVVKEKVTIGEGESKRVLVTSH
jgi:hypothetical protein